MTRAERLRVMGEDDGREGMEPAYLNMYLAIDKETELEQNEICMTSGRRHLRACCGCVDRPGERPGLRYSRYSHGPLGRHEDARTATLDAVTLAARSVRV